MPKTFKVNSSLSDHSGAHALDIPIYLDNIEVGALCLLKSKTSEVSALTAYQEAAFLIETNSIEINTKYYQFSHDYVVIADDHLTNYLSHRETSSFWGEYCHDEDLNSLNDNEGHVPDQINIDQHLSKPLSRQLDSLAKYATYSRSPEKFLFLYHCLEIEFDRSIVIAIRELDDLNPAGLSSLIAKLNNNELDRLKLLLCDFPTKKLEDHFLTLKSHEKSALRIFYEHGKESNPMKEDEHFKKYIIEPLYIDINTAHQIQKQHQLSYELGNPKTPDAYSSKMRNLACYWIYRIRCCIAHNKLGDYHLAGKEDIQLLNEFGIPLLKMILKHKFTKP